MFVHEQELKETKPLGWRRPPEGLAATAANLRLVVDLMKSACGLDYAAAGGITEIVEVQGVPIPFASTRLLWLTKQTYRGKDKIDRAFLARLLAGRGEALD